MACFQKNTHRYLSLGIVDIEYGTVPVNWFPARLLQMNKLLRQYAIKQKKCFFQHLKDLQSFKFLIWKIVWNLLTITKVILAHVTALNLD
jgi:hypothetical protein